MHIPVIHDGLAGNTGEHGRVGIPPEFPLSIESQLKLRALYEFVDFCRGILGEIERDLLHIELTPGGSPHLQHLAARLAKLGLEADNWGFNSLYEIAFGLQMLLLNAGGRIPSESCWGALQRGMKMLAALVEECEHDFRSRLAIADTLESLADASRGL